MNGSLYETMPEIEYAAEVPLPWICSMGAMLRLTEPYTFPLARASVIASLK